jgi:hypothetical protein
VQATLSRDATFSCAELGPVERPDTPLYPGAGAY